MNRRGIIPFIVMALAYCSISKADTVTNLQTGDSVDLDTYVNTPGMGILVGDKLFNNFTFVQSDSTGTTNSFLPASAIMLSPLGGMVGFGLQFSAPFFTAGGINKDFLIGYDVTVTNAPMLIHDIHLDYNGVFTGNGYSTVTETALDPANNVLGQVFVANPPGPLSTNFDLSTPQPTLHIKKDILLVGNITGSHGQQTPSTAFISFIDQQFSQVAIPEPSSMMLVATGLAGLLFWRRRS